MRFALGALLFLSAGCGTRVSYGESFDASAARPLADVLSRVGGGPLTVSGRVGQVCASSGCWFTLEDRSGPRDYSLLVDLKPAASFTVPASIRGRRAIVKGRLAGGPADRRLEAVGLLLE